MALFLKETHLPVVEDGLKPNFFVALILFLGPVVLGPVGLSADPSDPGENVCSSDSPLTLGYVMAFAASAGRPTLAEHDSFSKFAYDGKAEGRFAGVDSQYIRSATLSRQEDDQGDDKGYDSLKSFVTAKSFNGPVVLGIANSDDPIFSYLDARNLQAIKPLILDSWATGTGPQESMIVVIKHADIIYILGLRPRNADDCKPPQDDDIENDDSPPPTTPVSVPEDYPFSIPLAQTAKGPDISYFYGGRLDSSLNFIDNIERGETAVTLNPGAHVWQFHKGADFDAPLGTRLLAIADGTVLYTGSDDRKGYGRAVVVEHRLPGDEPGTVRYVYSLYAHLSQWNVKTGQKVRAGDHIGNMGKTGDATGSNIHLEIHVPKGGTKVLVWPANSSQRWHYFYDPHNTDVANVADFVRAVDEDCQIRKVREIKNAKQVQNKYDRVVGSRHVSSHLPPLTASLCSQKWEFQLRQRADGRELPRIYNYEAPKKVNLRSI